MAFAPLACNSFGQQAPELLQYQRIVADLAAQRVVSLPDFSLPTAADLPGVVDEHGSLLKLYQRSRDRGGVTAQSTFLSPISPLSPGVL